MPRSHIPFTQSSPAEIDSLILSYLSFRDLNVLSEEDNGEEFNKPAVVLLKKKNPYFINLKKEKSSGNFIALLKNIFTVVMPAIGYPEMGDFKNNNPEECYNTIVKFISPLLRGLIRNEFYSFKVKPKLESQVVRDCIFHYCQLNPCEAGKLLNQHIWKFWNSFVSDCLIEYGADVNAKWSDTAYPTLLQAMRWSASVTSINKLLEAGSEYDSYQEENNGIKFTILLVAALHVDEEVLGLLIKKFPQKISEAYDSLNDMYDNFEEEKYVIRFNNESFLTGSLNRNSYYTRSDIYQAIEKVLSVTQKINPLLLYAADNQSKQIFNRP